MRANLAKSTWFVAIVATILLLVASPSVAAASMDCTAETHDSSHCQEGAAIPQCCCLMANCTLSYCILTSTVTNEVLLPSRLTPNENVYMAWSQTSVTTETPLNPKKPFQRDPPQELPSRLHTEYHCRNCLNSEEPHQV